jgi:hypothetical protein
MDAETSIHIHFSGMRIYAVVITVIRRTGGGKRPQPAPRMGWRWDGCGPSRSNIQISIYPQSGLTYIFIFPPVPLNHTHLPLFTIIYLFLKVEVDIWI